MYPTSEDYKKAIRDYNRIVKVEGIITLDDGTSVIIEDKDIVQGSLYINNQCVSGDGLDPGSVHIGELGISLISHTSKRPKPENNFTWAEANFSWRDAYIIWAGSAESIRWSEASIAWQDANFAWTDTATEPLESVHTLNGAKIEIRYGLLVNDEYEWIPLGKYTIIETNHKIGVVQLVAYDNMVKFDKEITNDDATPTVATAYTYLNQACTKCGVEFDLTQTQVEALPNGTEDLYFNFGNEITTWRDLISWVAQILGCFATITRDGKLTLKTYVGEPVRVISSDERDNTSVEDFGVKVSSISSKIAGNEYTVSTGETGNTLVLDENPLIKARKGTDIENILNELLLSFENVLYVPSKFTFMGDPSLEVGDYITLIGGSAGYAPGIKTLITHYNWKYRAGHSIEGVGKPGTISVKKTQTQKKLEQSVRLGSSYYGTTITADKGLMVEKYNENKAPIARAILNADTLSMQYFDGFDWIDGLYFDPKNKKYKFNGELEAASGTFTGLLKSGEIESSVIKSSTINASEINSTTINGGTITGTEIKSNSMIDVTTSVYIGDNLYIDSNTTNEGIHFGSVAPECGITLLDSGGAINIKPTLSENGKRVATRDWVEQNYVKIHSGDKISLRYNDGRVAVYSNGNYVGFITLEG